jgi:transcriptional regulator with XRE-family HTH domain
MKHVAKRTAQQAIGAAVRFERKRTGISARALSRRLNQSQNYISRVESGRPIWAHQLGAIGQALGIRGSTLMSRAERERA